MRCFSCDTNLTDFESTRKSKVTGDYLDLCEDCFSTVVEEFIIVEEKIELKLLQSESITLGIDGILAEERTK